MPGDGGEEVYKEHAAACLKIARRTDCWLRRSRFLRLSRVKEERCSARSRLIQTQRRIPERPPQLAVFSFVLMLQCVRQKMARLCRAD